MEILARIAAGVILLAAFPAPAQVHAQHQNVECTRCHLPAGPFTLNRPESAQCAGCHAKPMPLSFPPHDRQHTITTRFSHASHVDPKARISGAAGFRADCTYCHKFDRAGVFAGMPSHEQCGACHARAFQSKDCGMCHSKVEGVRPPVAYEDIAFSHASHFRQKNSLEDRLHHLPFGNSAPLTSTAKLALPRMLACVACHDQSPQDAGALADVQLPDLPHRFA